MTTRSSRSVDPTTAADPVGARIATTFPAFDVHKACGSHTLTDRRSGEAVARLRPWPDTNRLELLSWSRVRERWTSFGNLGRLKLHLDSAAEIIDAEPIFRVKPKSLLARIFG